MRTVHVYLLLAAAALFWAGCDLMFVSTPPPPQDTPEESAPASLYLANLELKWSSGGGNLLQFVRETQNYQVNIETGRENETLILSAVAGDPTIQLRAGTGSGYQSGTGKITVDKIPAPKTGGGGTVCQISQGMGRPVYTVTIAPPQLDTVDNDDLQILTVSYDSSQANLLTPTFTQANTSYSVATANGKTSLSVFARAASSQSRVELYYDGELLAQGLGTDGANAAIAIPAHNEAGSLAAVVYKSDNSGSKPYSVTINGYLERTVTYTGQATYTGTGKVIAGVTAKNAAELTQGAVLDLENPLTGGFTWTLTVSEFYTPHSFLVTLEDASPPAGTQPKRYSSRLFRVASPAPATPIALTVEAADAGRGIFSANDLYEALNNSANSGETFVLANDVDLSAYTDSTGTPIPWTGPSGYRGKFIGNGYTIKNLLLRQSTASDRDVGMFKSLGNGAWIEDMNIEVTTENPNATMNGLFFGAIAGFVDPGTNGVLTIKKVNVTGTLHFGDISSYMNVGGIIGVMQNGSVTIEQCTTSLDIALSAGTGAASQHNSYGGLVATVGGGSLTVLNSASRGNIRVKNSVDQMIRAGGLVGCTWTNNPATITARNSYTSGSIIVESTRTNWSGGREICAGGLIGAVIENNKTVNLINCAVLSAKVLTITESTAPETRGFGGRLIGRVYNAAPAALVTTTNNVANSAMLQGYTTGGAVLDYTADNAPDALCGANVTLEAMRQTSAWTGTLQWPSAIWDFSALASGGLPSLK
ncbi:MAG: hypothetical protein LBC72_00285 [Spirochaetaceae bacterium]|jgi:hypothetical protein|nr:hypothetical protein [Spirochaetaceae bacterium]